MKVFTFYLDGARGTIDSDGWIRWATINCHVNGLAQCSLREKALAALNKK